MEKYWAQANSALHAFTGQENNEPYATELAIAWRTGDQNKVDQILGQYKGSKETLVIDGVTYKKQ